MPRFRGFAQAGKPDTPQFLAAEIQRSQAENQAKMQANALRSQNMLGTAGVYNEAMGDRTPIADFIENTLGGAETPEFTDEQLNYDPNMPDEVLEGQEIFEGVEGVEGLDTADGTLRGDIMSAVDATEGAEALDAAAGTGEALTGAETVAAGEGRCGCRSCCSDRSGSHYSRR